ncbi:hypothetical protein L6452_20678 [Arctium lappa]|uniref:Uncharacterized protein n=1 Tax=Arctium lappa TaxID=4217 RepID=A0ACB9BB76_ARCLA|nr:hypothetical protein L6452_20678 [Arctium lappa]
MTMAGSNFEIFGFGSVTDLPTNGYSFTPSILAGHNRQKRRRRAPLSATAIVRRHTAVKREASNNPSSQRKF